MIDILLATYNGEKYIEAQLYSLLMQTERNWRLVVHDDGSNDKTLDIIKRFQKIDNRIVLIEDGIRCGGAAQNFLHLLKNYSTADYIIFCDQDDIWFESKLEDLKTAFRNEQPMAVFCNGYAYAQDKGILSGNITASYPKNLREQLFMNAGVQGCSLMFNRQLKNGIDVYPEQQAMHDHFITLFAICFGELKYLDKHLMLYRQFHDGKATANIDKSLKKRFFSDIPVIDRKHYLATKSFFHTYENKLSPIQKHLFLEYFKFANSGSVINRLKIIFENRFPLNGSIFQMLIKTIVRRPIN